MIFTRPLQKRMEIILEEKQARDLAKFKKGYLTIDYIFIQNQSIEKSNEYNPPSYVGLIDYPKGFDLIDQFAIYFQSTQKKLRSMDHMCNLGCNSQ